MVQNTDLGASDRLRPLLRITMRCLDEDLDGTTASDAERPVEALEHALVRKFVAMRSQDPTGTEKIQPLKNAEEVYSLHSGRWRGATWHDRENNAVWLLAGRLHRSGAPDDAYPYIKSIDADERLLPREGDYELLFLAQAWFFADDVMNRVPLIMDEARRRSPSEVKAVLGTVPISVAVVAEDGMEFVYLAVMMSGWTEDGPEPPSEWMTILWAAFFPWVTDFVNEIGLENEIAGRPAKEGELIYSSIREE